MGYTSMNSSKINALKPRAQKKSLWARHTEQQKKKKLNKTLPGGLENYKKENMVIVSTFQKETK